MTGLYKFLTYLILSVTLISCGKTLFNPDPITLPEATQSGENTFGCKVDGVIWLPEGNISYPSIADQAYISSYGTFGFTSFNNSSSNTHRQSIRIVIKSGFYDIGIYKLPLDEYISTFTDGKDYFADSTQTNEINITRIDLEAKIISGLFEFTLITTDKSDTIYVTEGRFDVADVSVF